MHVSYFNHLFCIEDNKLLGEMQILGEQNRFKIRDGLISGIQPATAEYDWLRHYIETALGLEKRAWEYLARITTDDFIIGAVLISNGACQYHTFLDSFLSEISVLLAHVRGAAQIQVNGEFYNARIADRPVNRSGDDSDYKVCHQLFFLRNQEYEAAALTMEIIATYPSLDNAVAVLERELKETITTNVASIRRVIDDLMRVIDSTGLRHIAGLRFIYEFKAKGIRLIMDYQNLLSSLIYHGNRMRSPSCVADAVRARLSEANL